MEHVVHERALARAGHAGDHAEHAERQVHVECSRRLCSAAPRMESQARGVRRCVGMGIESAPVRYWAVRDEPRGWRMEDGREPERDLAVRLEWKRSVLLCWRQRARFGR